MINILIVDDEAPAREIILHYLKDYPEIHIAGEASNGFEAMKIIKEQMPPLIFLDVQMPKLTGFEMLELIESPPEIIFSTAYDQFAIKAFELNAIDYLLKPYSRQRFDTAVQKAFMRINSGLGSSVNLKALRKTVEVQPGFLERIAVKDRQQIYVIPIHEIDYIEAEGDYVRLYTKKSSFLKEKTMKYLEENLSAQQFIRIHRSFIVNVEEVSKIELYEKDNYRVYLKRGVMLKASSSGYKALKQAVRL
jgi:two-component system LytT family response regulator